MNCVIYKGHRKPYTYLYIERVDDFERVPGALLELMGELEKVLELDLDPARHLVNANATEVIQLLDSQGYYLQMPPERHSPLHQFLS